MEIKSSAINWRTALGADPIHTNKPTPVAGAPVEEADSAAPPPFLMVAGEDLTGAEIKPGHTFIVGGRDIAPANDDELLLTEDMIEQPAPRKRRFASLYNAGAGVFHGLKQSFTTKAGLKDLGIGMALGSGLKMGAIGLGAAGILTVSAPVIFGLGVAGSVARTVWQINKERHAAAQEAGLPVANLFSRDFFKAVGQSIDWAKDNKGRAGMLLGGTMLSMVGAVGAIAAISHIKDWLFDSAPVAPVAVPVKPSVPAAAVLPQSAPSAPVAIIEPKAAPVAVPIEPKAPVAQVAAPVAVPAPVAPVAEVAAPVSAPAPVATAPVAIEAPKVDVAPQAVAPVAVPRIEPDLSVTTLDDTIIVPMETPNIDVPLMDMPKIEVAPETAAPAYAPVAAPVVPTPMVAPAPVIETPKFTAPISVAPQSLAPELASAPNVNSAFNLVLTPQPDGTFIGRVKGLAEGVTKFRAEVSPLAFILK